MNFLVISHFAKKRKKKKRGKRSVSFQQDPPKELCQVAMKALSLKKEDRYQSVGEMASDIRAFLEGRMLKAVKYSFVERCIKWIKRHKAANAVVGIGVAAILIITGVLLWSAAARTREREMSKIRIKVVYLVC